MWKTEKPFQILRIFLTAIFLTASFYMLGVTRCSAKNPMEIGKTSLQFTTKSPGIGTSKKASPTDEERPKPLTSHLPKPDKPLDESYRVKQGVQETSHGIPSQVTTGQYLVEQSRDKEASRNSNVMQAAGEKPLPSPTPDDRDGGKIYFDYSVLPKEMRSAEFLGILPGVTAEDEIADILGSSNDFSKQGGYARYGYNDLEGLGDVEILCKNGVVDSLVVRLAVAFPAAQIAQVLENELKNIRSILVPDENGEVLGQLFPEKGLTFVFAPSNVHGESSEMVTQIGIEQVSAEPFVLRGERYLSIAISKAKWDLSVAVMLDPKNHRAHWLLSKANFQLGNLSEAIKNCQKAIDLDEKQPQYHVTLAMLMGEAGQVNEARRYLTEVLPLCNAIPHVKGQAECLIGDFYRKGNPPDYQKAIKSYQKAIETAGSLVSSKNPTQRQLTKETLLDAHLNTALTISGSNMEKKGIAIEQWLKLAGELAEDLVIREKASQIHLLHVASTALAIYLESDDDSDITPYIKEVQNIGKLLISQSDDPAKNRIVEKEMGMAIYNAAQIYQVREDYKNAVKYAEIAENHLEKALGEEINVLDRYRVARVAYRIGAIYAVQEKHKEAIKWYSKAIPYFKDVEFSLDASDQPRLGEIYVNIGISYWEIGEKEYAVKISDYGVGRLEQAVEDGFLDQKVLVTPYGNLSKMYRKLEQNMEADEYLLKANQAKGNFTVGTGSDTEKRRR